LAARRCQRVRRGLLRLCGMKDDVATFVLYGLTKKREKREKREEEGE
jgi:hypothetical protein